MSELFSETAASSPAGGDPSWASAAPLDLLRQAPALSSAQARLSRLVGRGLRLDLPDGMQLLMSPHPGGASQSARPENGPDDRHWLALETAGGIVHVEQGARLLAGLTGIDGNGGNNGNKADSSWPSWLVGALAGHLAGTPLASLWTVRNARPPQPAALLWQQWQLRGEDHAISSAVAAAPATWLALLEPLAVEPLYMSWARWSSLAVSCPLELGRHRLPLALYRTLASGDLILPDSVHFDLAGQGSVVLGARRWQVRFVAPRRLQLLNEETLLESDLIDDDASGEPVQAGRPSRYDAHDPYRQEDRQDRDEAASHAAHERDEDGDGDGDDRDDDYRDEQQEQPEHRDQGQERGQERRPEASRNPGAVALTLRFELGRIDLTLDRLRTLGPQSVLELHGGSSQSLAIVCGGVEVGRGEVVAVDGRLGVRILHWGGAC